MLQLPRFTSPTRELTHSGRNDVRYRTPIHTLSVSLLMWLMLQNSTPQCECLSRITLRRALGGSARGTVVPGSSRDEAWARRAPAVSDASQRVVGVGDLRAAPRRGTRTHARQVSTHAGDPLTEAGRTVMNDVRQTVGQRRAVVSAGCCTHCGLDGRGLRARMGAGQGEFGSCAHRLGTVIQL